MISRLPRKAVKSMFGRMGFALMREAELSALRKRLYTQADIDFLRALPSAALAPALGWLKESKSQIRQGLFVLSRTGFKHDGFFVEFGATDGVGLSNTWLLEKHFGWRGILAEPARSWHA